MLLNTDDSTEILFPFYQLAKYSNCDAPKLITINQVGHSTDSQVSVQRQDHDDKGDICCLGELSKEENANKEHEHKVRSMMNAYNQTAEGKVTG